MCLKPVSIGRSILLTMFYIFTIALSHAEVGSEPLTLSKAVDTAIEKDPWLEKSVLQESALQQRANSENALPDPTLKLGLLNVPVDSFDLDQEPMTQIKASVVWKIPRGNSRSLKSRTFSEQADVQPLQRSARKSEVIRDVSLLWLEGWFAQASLELLNENRYLFEELRSITRSNYNSGFGTSRQQDLILADLELIRLDDRILKFELKHTAARDSLSKWLTEEISGYRFAELTESGLLSPSVQETRSSVEQHPSLLAIRQKQAVADTKLSLQRESTKPDWAMELGYAHRLDAPNGQERADFLSLGVSLNLPSLNQERTAGLINAAHDQRNILDKDYALKKRAFTSGLEKARTDRNNVRKRLTLYKETYLQQLALRIEAITNAYTADSINFEEVMRAQLQELNAKLEVIALQFQMSKADVLIDYYLTRFDPKGTQS